MGLQAKTITERGYFQGNGDGTVTWWRQAFLFPHGRWGYAQGATYQITLIDGAGFGFGIELSRKS